MDFSNFIAGVSDFRRKEGQRYSFSSVMWLIFSAVGCGYVSSRNISSFGAIHFKFFQHKFGWKSHPSYYVIHTFLSKLNSEEFCKTFNVLCSQEASSFPKDCWLSGDGQTLCSTVSNANNSNQNYVSLVSLFCKEMGLTVAISSYENKEKNVGESSVLLALVDNYFAEKGLTFTMDALHCQKKL